MAFCLYRTADLVSTRKLPLFQPTHDDFGAGVDRLVSAWPWITDTNEEESSRRVIVNIPPMAPMWFTWNPTACEFEGDGNTKD